MTTRRMGKLVLRKTRSYFDAFVEQVKVHVRRIEWSNFCLFDENASHHFNRNNIPIYTRIAS